MAYFLSLRFFKPRFRVVAFLAAALLVVAGAFVRAEDPSIAAFRGQTLALLKTFKASPTVDAAAASLASASTIREVDAAVSSLTLASVGINPEGRVKIASAPDRIDLVAGVPRRFFVRVENLAGVTAPLRLRGLDQASPAGAEAAWLTLNFIDAAASEAPRATADLSGTTDELFVVELLVSESGLREVRLVADAGQGTQDLGFRATADVRLRIASSRDRAP